MRPTWKFWLAVGGGVAAGAIAAKLVTSSGRKLESYLPGMSGITSATVDGVTVDAEVIDPLRGGVREQLADRVLRHSVGWWDRELRRVVNPREE